ncbi:hypothetical protein BO71DRAFT_485385 [Aspergillus ellipticus CBS 707.79]|uniref:Uncharacterized protein n=1 Tax=Aspergillus ellipticus CBS 707.79 TaxID=1448320 RepID=A0A319DWG1_9EURO|nr:hypothetical protein BO71DRAFT_485385 [Aspergillus ellipticus CBS 707.79]
MEHEQTLEEIRASCSIITRTIISHLHLMQTFGSGYPKDARTFKQFWPREDVEALKERLSTIKSEFEPRDQSFQTGEMVRTRKLLDSLDINDDSREREEVQPKPDAAPKTKIPKGNNMMSLFGKGPAGKKSMFVAEAPKTYTKDTEFTDQEMIIRDCSLESLKFSSMTDREDSVTVAHGGTFDWIFSDTTGHEKSEVEESLTRWLSNVHDSGIYWISGKPGSGKSTLVHFLRHHTKTTDLLQSWAGDEPLITAGFYFWISGTLAQRSQTGLMRHLLFQLLDQEKHLVPTVFPTKWKHYMSLSTRERIRASVSWGLEELKDALRHFMRHTAGQAKVCLFIDGLDEFAGDHTGIVKFLKTTAASFPHVKFCLSSRPLPVFRAAFGNSPGLELHDLTRQDMLRYAKDHLHGNSSIQTVFANNAHGASHLIDEVVERADGVFLWVTLVVQSLLRRQDYQEISQMHEYLLQHPADIDELFTYFIFEQSTKDQTFMTSRLFQLLQAREEACHATGQDEAVTMRIWELAFAAQLDKENIAISEDVHQATDEFITRLCETTKSHFSKECAGLIITHAPSQSAIRTRANQSPAQQLAQSKVSYIPRTAKDYLSLRPIWTRILEITINSSFDPHLSLLISHILQLKHPLDPYKPHRQTGRMVAQHPPRLHPRATLPLPIFPTPLHPNLRPRPHPILGLPRQPRKRPLDTQPLLDLRKTQKRHLRKPLPLPRRQIRPLHPRPPPNPTTPHLHPRRTHPPPQPLPGIPLQPPQNVYPLSSPQIIGDLLAHGADPNQPYLDLDKKSRTPWLVVLENLREAERRRWIRYYDTDAEGSRRLARIVELFLGAGADSNALLVESRFDPSATALEVVTSVYRKYAAEEFGGLRGELLTLGATEREGNGVFYRVYGE